MIFTSTNTIPCNKLLNIIYDVNAALDFIAIQFNDANILILTICDRIFHSICMYSTYIYVLEAMSEVTFHIKGYNLCSACSFAPSEQFMVVIITAGIASHRYIAIAILRSLHQVKLKNKCVKWVQWCAR